MNMMDRLSAALLASLTEQWKIQPDGSAVGGSLKVGSLVRAVLTELREPSPVLAKAVADKFWEEDMRLTDEHAQEVITFALDAILEGRF